MLDDATREKIDQHLPTYVTSQNPVDGTAGFIRILGYARVSQIIASSEAVVGVITVASTRSANALLVENNALIELDRQTEKQILFWSYTLPDPRATEKLAKARILF